jgi:hypothetical protein
MSDYELEIGSASSYNDNSDTIVLVFYKDTGEDMWQTDTVNFDRVPVAGEYLALSRDGGWYEVKAVVHMAFPLDYDAELYCVKVADRVALRQSFGN